MVFIPDLSNPKCGILAPLSYEEENIRKQLATHIEYLSAQLGERNLLHYQNLQTAAEYIKMNFKNHGCMVSEQPHMTDHFLVKNIITEYRGTLYPDEIIVVGAHYDTIAGSPGADDNASGVAAIIEFSRLLAHSKLKRTVRFVGFVNEEPPFFYTKKMGSWHYAHEARKKNENIIAMLSIESIGYYSAVKKSQRYPFPLNLLYPDTANFIGFVGNLASRALMLEALTSFRQHAIFPAEGISTPGWLIGIGWSDHHSFWKHGYPAIMVTGTALFRNPNYHCNTDTFDTIDYIRTARVVNGLTQVIRELANKENNEDNSDNK